MSALPSEKVALVATIDPDAYSAGTQTSDWVLTENFHEFLAVVYAGIIVASGKIDAVLRQASSSTGGSNKAITGKSITQLTTGDNDKQAIINLRTDELDVDGGFKWIALRMTFTTAGADAGGTIYALEPRFGPANANDLASVDEIIA